MGKKSKTGYQGVPFSNNYYAAQVFTQDRPNEVLVPLVSSKQVVDALLNQDIDFGIMALRNSIIGEVRETAEALANQPVVEVKKIDLKIRHAGFKMSADLPNEEVRFVASHEAALAQCSGNIRARYPNAQILPIENTALGPKYLKEGRLDPFTVVLCPPQAGLHYQLFMDIENLSDSLKNTTTFGVFVLDGRQTGH